MGGRGAAAARSQFKDLQRLPDPPAAVAPESEPPLPMRWAQANVDEIVEAVRTYQMERARVRGTKAVLSQPMRGARIILDYLALLPGDSWNDRWLLLDAESVGRDWRSIVRPERTDGENQAITWGLSTLLVLDVFRPSHAWQHHRPVQIYRQLGEYRDAEALQMVTARIDQDATPGTGKHIKHALGKIQSHTGKSVRQITAQDLLIMDAALQEIDAGSHHRRAVAHLWRVLTELGWIHHESYSWPVHRKRRPRRGPEEVVDSYGVSSPHREVLIEYLKQRHAVLDYSTFRNNAKKLIKDFWLDVYRHHPDLTTFALTRAQADGWKDRLRSRKQDGSEVDAFNVLLVVRAFYLDMSQWALEDSFWVPWATSSPISRAEVTGYNKVRRRQIARTQQRTRQVAPVLPQLVSQAETDQRSAAAALTAAATAGHGGMIDLDGTLWKVRQSTSKSPIRIDRDDPDRGPQSRNLTREEDMAFWTWAIVETLRLTGVRREELLELTHMSIVPYRVPDTGEEIPLLHIAPSKTDEERLLVAGPELVHVLAQVIHRVRGGQQDIPLTQRWDVGDHRLSDPMPHLFARWFGPEFRPMSGATVLHLLHRLAERADIRINGEPVHFTIHDFRRVFATDALASGLPPHIVQVLLGHKSLATTQVYAAVYPQDVIRHHRTWIGQRRLQRPGEEYRQPTPTEWEEFEAHFVTRRVSLGTCGRAYGTNCHHEHACIRCSLLRPDPAQEQRLRDIITNLNDRIAEAEHNHWLGEVEGLKISLAGAESKLTEIERQHQAGGTIDLGMPRISQRPRCDHR